MTSKIRSQPQHTQRKNCNAILFLNGKRLFSWLNSRAQNSAGAVTGAFGQAVETINRFGASYLAAKEYAIDASANSLETSLQHVAHAARQSKRAATALIQLPGRAALSVSEGSKNAAGAAIGKARLVIEQCRPTLTPLKEPGVQLVIAAGAVAAFANFFSLSKTTAYLVPCGAFVWHNLPPIGPLSKDTAKLFYHKLPSSVKIALQLGGVIGAGSFFYEHSTKIILYPTLLSAIAALNLSSRERNELINQIKERNLVEKTREQFKTFVLNLGPYLPRPAQEIINHLHGQGNGFVLIGQPISAGLKPTELNELMKQLHAGQVLFNADQPPRTEIRQLKSKKLQSENPNSPEHLSLSNLQPKARDPSSQPFVVKVPTFPPPSELEESKSPDSPRILPSDTASISPRSALSVPAVIQNGSLDPEPTLLDREAESNKRKLEIQKERTKKELEGFTRNLKCFIPLKKFFEIAEIECDPAQFNPLLSQAKNGDSSTLKQLFLSKYADRLSWLKRVKIHLWCRVFSLGVFSKTIDSYSIQILEIARKKASDHRLVEDGEMIAGLIDKFQDYLDRLLGKILKHLNGPPLTAKQFNQFLDRINKEVTEEIFSVSNRDTCNMFSEVIIDHLSPEVEYFSVFQKPVRVLNSCIRFIDRQINWIVRRLLRGFILPNALYSVIEKTDESTSPESLSFTTAWTKVMNGQLQKLIAQIENRSGSEPQNTTLPGTENLEELVSLLFQNLQFQDLKDANAIKQKQEELLDPNKRQEFSEKVKEGIQESIVKAIKTMGSLLTPQTFEELNGNFLSVANTTFETTQNTKAEEATKAVEDFDKTIRTLGSKLSSKAVNDQLNPNRPEHAVKLTQERFENERKRILDAIADIHAFASEMPIPEKVEIWKQETDILPDLGAMQKILEQFDERNLNKAISELNPPDQNAILQPLIPIYQKIVELKEKIKKLQEEQLEQQANFQNKENYRKIKEEIGKIQENSSLEEKRKHLSNIEKEISSADESRDCKYLLPHTKALLEITTQCDAKEKELDHLNQLSAQLRLQQEAIRNNSGAQKNKRLTRVRKIVAELTIPQGLSDRIRICCNQKIEESASWEALFDEIRQTIQSCNSQKDQLKKRLTDKVAEIALFCAKRERHFEGAQNKNCQNLIEHKQSFIKLIGSLQDLTQKMELSNLLHLNAEHLTLMGKAGLAALTLFSPPLGLAAASAAHAAVHQMPEIIQRKSVDTSLNRFAAGTGGAIGAGLAAVPGIGPVSAAALAAFMGAQAGSQLIDRTIEAGEKGVSENVEKFFSQSYTFFKGRIIVGIIKILMWQIIESYRPELKKKK